MPQIFPGRYTATHDGPVTVFLIGMRLNQPLRADLWWPVFSAMPRMLAHLAKDQSAGMLGFQNWFLPSPVVLSYWRSPEHLQRFAANPDAPHLRPWRAFNKAVGNSGGILKASDEDIDYISEAGGYEGNALEVAVEWARAYDPALVVVTLGADGVAAIKRDGRKVQVPGFKIDLVDTVGAGDTFMAGFLSAYTKNPEDLKTALTRGAASAAIVCSRQGANPPTTEELEQFLADNA